jgi:hypothetical protein
MPCSLHCSPSVGRLDNHLRGRVWRCPDSFHEETAARIAREHGMSEGVVRGGGRRM